jgi:hypothetical protein
MQTRVYDSITGDLITSQEIIKQHEPTLYLNENNVAIVRDTSYFGATSPVYGGRTRIEAGQSLGTLRYASLLADYRRYFMAEAPDHHRAPGNALRPLRPRLRRRPPGRSVSWLSRVGAGVRSRFVRRTRLQRPHHGRRVHDLQQLARQSSGRREHRGARAARWAFPGRDRLRASACRSGGLLRCRRRVEQGNQPLVHRAANAMSYGASARPSGATSSGLSSSSWRSRARSIRANHGLQWQFGIRQGF